MSGCLDVWITWVHWFVWITGSHPLHCAQRNARAEAARLAHVAQPSRTRSGRESRPAMVRNNPDLRGIEPRRTRNQRMSWWSVWSELYEWPCIDSNSNLSFRKCDISHGKNQNSFDIDISSCNHLLTPHRCKDCSTQCDLSVHKVLKYLHSELIKSAPRITHCNLLKNKIQLCGLFRYWMVSWRVLMPFGWAWRQGSPHLGFGTTTSHGWPCMCPNPNMQFRPWVRLCKMHHWPWPEHGQIMARSWPK